MEIIKDFNQILLEISFYGSFLATVVAAFIFFFIKEVISPPKKIIGSFFIYTKTKDTSYNPYYNLIECRNFIVYSDGKNIKGSSEKTHEINNNNEILNYKPHDRIMGKVSGFLEHNYLKKSKVHFHLIEKNKDSRESSTTISIKLKRCEINKSCGTFYSTAAKSSGISMLLEQHIENPFI